MLFDITFSDISNYSIYLQNQGLAESSQAAYLRVAKQFLTSNPKIDLPSSYLDFLVETAGKKRCFHNVYALISFVKFKFDDDKKKMNEILSSINVRKFRQKDPKKYQDTKPLTDEELIKVLEGLEYEKHKIIFMIMYETGLRISDVLRIKAGGVYWDKEDNIAVLKIKTESKGEKSRTLTIWNKESADNIVKYINSIELTNEYFFIEKEHHTPKLSLPTTDYRRRYLNYFYCWEDIKQSLNKAGIDKKRFATHSLRRNFARRAWEATHNIYELQRLMAHKDVNTTAGYLREEGYDISKTLRKIQIGK